MLVFEGHCVTDSCSPDFHDVDVETLVVLQRHHDVETGVRVNFPRLSVLGFDVGHYHAPQGCEWVFHIVVLPVDMGICRHYWCGIALL
jgi:hypothetical protein